MSTLDRCISLICCLNDCSCGNIDAAAAAAATTAMVLPSEAELTVSIFAVYISSVCCVLHTLANMFNLGIFSMCRLPYWVLLNMATWLGL